MSSDSVSPVQEPNGAPVRMRDRRTKGLESAAVKSCLRVRSVVSDSLQPRGLQPPGSSVHGILQARILE